MEHSENSLSRRDFIVAAGLAGTGVLLAGCASQPNTTAAAPSPSPTPSEMSSQPIQVKPILQDSQPPRTTITRTETLTLTPTPKTSSAVPRTHPELPNDYFIVTGPENQPNVSITIDDFSGSGALDYLEGLIRLGREKRTKFTLFPIGQWLVEQNTTRGRSLWQTALRDGHIVGNHTYTHDELIATRSTKRIMSELAGQQRALNNVLGWRCPEFLMRPPGGSGGYPTNNPNDEATRLFNREVDLLKQLGYWMTMWSTDSNDKNGNPVTPGATVQQQDARFLSKIFHGANGSTYEEVRNGSIILVHPDTLSLTGMGKLLDGLQAQHYNRVTVPGLFAHA